MLAVGMQDNVHKLQIICRLQCGASLGCYDVQKALVSLGGDQGASRSISFSVSKGKENMGQADSETTEYVFSCFVCCRLFSDILVPACLCPAAYKALYVCIISILAGRLHCIKLVSSL